MSSVRGKTVVELHVLHEDKQLPVSDRELFLRINHVMLARDCTYFVS